MQTPKKQTPPPAKIVPMDPAKLRALFDTVTKRHAGTIKRLADR